MVTLNAEAAAAAGRLELDSRGRITGPISVSYSPTRAHGTDSGAILGTVMHTMVCNLPVANDIFMDPANQASAMVGISQTGHVIQWIPYGLGFYPWAQKAGNRMYYATELADDGDPTNPLTDRQLTAFAQIVEFESRFAGFPLEIANRPGQLGLGVHYMGGPDWGGHTCPDTGPSHPIRSLQRPEVLRRARAIRAGHGVTAGGPSAHAANGMSSMSDFAHVHGADVEEIVFLTARHAPAEGFGRRQRSYLNAGRWDRHMPKGMAVWAP